MLKIIKSIKDKTVCLGLMGRLDTTTVPALKKELGDSLKGMEELILDLKKLEYISSAGLRVLLAAQKSMNRLGGMKVLHVNDTVMEIFEVTGFSKILSIVEAGHEAAEDLEQFGFRR